MAKTVKMLVQISGTRNGKDWPAPGETISVGDDEAETLIRNGQATTGKTQDENALADVLGVETAANLSTKEGQASVRAQLSPAAHANEEQAFHVPVLPGEKAAAEKAQEDADKANKDLGVPVAENVDLRGDEEAPGESKEAKATAKKADK